MFRMRSLNRGRVAAVLAAATLLLTACGPASLHSRIPSIPHIYLFQNTAPVQTPVTNLILPLTQLPGPYQQKAVLPADNASSIQKSLTPDATRAEYERWHRLDGATGVFELPPAKDAGFFARSSQVQIDVGRYQTEKDAEGAYKAIALTPPALPQTVRLPDPGIAPLTTVYDTTLSDAHSRAIYFQERNVVVRVLVIGPADSPALASAATIAQREHDLIAAAK